MSAKSRLISTQVKVDIGVELVNNLKQSSFDIIDISLVSQRKLLVFQHLIRLGKRENLFSLIVHIHGTMVAELYSAKYQIAMLVSQPDYLVS